MTRAVKKDNELFAKCACGHVEVFASSESGQCRPCPDCGREIRLIQPELKKKRAMPVICPKCGKETDRIFGSCMHCGAQVAFTTGRITAFAIAALIACALILIGIGGAMTRTRVGQLADSLERYHWAYKYKQWDTVNSMRLVRGRSDFSPIMDKALLSLQNLNFNVIKSEINPDRRSAVATVEFSADYAASGSAPRRIAAVVSESWEYADKSWRLSDADEVRAFIDREVQKLAAIADSHPKVLATCPICAGAGRQSCAACEGKGALPDGSFCARCFKSQGWNVCESCRGAGKILKDAPEGADGK
jgi:hypothetical protein